MQVGLFHFCIIFCVLWLFTAQAMGPPGGLTCPAPNESTTAGSVIVNEFSYHGDGAQNDWIELYVNSGPQNLSGWQLILKGPGSNDDEITLGSMDIPWSETSSNGRFIILASSTSDTNIQAAIDNGSLVEGTNLFILPDLSLHNTTQEILLVDDAGDLVYYIANGNVNNPGFEYDCADLYPDYADEIRENGNEDQACTAVDGASNGNTIDDWEAGCSGSTTPGSSNSGEEPPVFACSAVFPDGASTHSNTGNISFGFNARLIDSDNNQLATSSISKNGGSSIDTCNTTDCIATGVPSDEVPSLSFQISSSSTNINLNYQDAVVVGEGSYSGNEFDQINPSYASEATITFSDDNDEYYVNTLVVAFQNILYLQAGSTYWIDQLILSSQSEIIVLGSGTAQIYVNQSVSFPSPGLINSPSINNSGDASKLVMYGFSDITFNNNSTFTGSLYSEGNINLGSASYAFGAISAENIQLGSQSTITYQSAAVADTDFGELCSDTVTEQLVGFYQFEQNEWLNAGDVLDSSDAANNGDPLGSISPFLDTTTQISCQALEIENNTSSSTISAVDTGIDINDLGEDGTISFWYKSNNNWSGGGNRQLLDASSRAAGNKYFFLVLRSDGSLRFGLEYSDDDDLYSTTGNYTFSADEWVHIAITWDPLNADLDIYVNGVQAATTDSIEIPEGGSINDLGTLHIGDNSTTYLVNGASGNSANGYFDDVRIYDFRQTSSQISTDLATVSRCEIEPIAFYQFEQESWSASGDVLDSTDNNNNGSPINSNISSQLASDQIACRYLDVPENTDSGVFDAIDTGVKASTLGNVGTISFWYKSNEDWDAGSARQLMDASTRSAANSDPNKHFHLVLTSAGSLEFSLEDANDRHLTAETDTNFTIAADTWTHIAVSWDLPNQSVQLVVNGANQTVSYNNSSGLVDEISDTNTIYIGDNRSDYFQFSSSGNSADGQFDDVRLYNLQQNIAQINEDKDDRTSCDVLNHYRIEHDKQGFTCEAEAITIKACANESCSELYDQLTEITLSPSGFAGSDTHSFTGQKTTSVSITEQSIITFSKISASPDAELRCFNGSEETCNMTFSNDGFEIFGANVGDLLPDQLAANNFENINIRAVRDSAGVCEALLEGEQEITIGYDCDSPNNCVTPLSSIAVDADPSGYSFGTIDIEFNADGIASLNVLNYPDAGRLKLQVQAVVDGVTITASDEELVDVYPSYLALSVDQTELNYGTTGAQNNYVAAENFTFTIGAYGTNDNLLPNYQAENPQLKVTRITPSTEGEDGSFVYSASGLTTASISAVFSQAIGLSFSEGEHDFSAAYYTEVGRIEVDTKDADYLGNEIVSNGAMLLGDFYPKYFSAELTETPVLANTCNDAFSYIGQTINFATAPEVTITAHNALGTKTNNYSDTYWNYQPNETTLETHLSYLDSSSYADDVTNSASVIDLGDAPVLTENDNFDGTGIFTFNNGSFRYNKMDPSDNTAYTPVSPFAASIDLAFSSGFFESTFTDQNGDTDTICLQASHTETTCLGFNIDNVTGTQLRYGRLVLESTYGPESDPIRVPIKAEYFSNDQWLLNTADNCSSIAFDQSASHLLLTGNSDVIDEVGTVTSTGQLLLGVADDSDDLLLGAPGISGEIQLQLNPTADPTGWFNYLNYDWNGDGVINVQDYPAANISFGLFRGNDKIIHWREVFN